MSSEEDTELRDLVAQTLESNGVLGKIRAQLRANVFFALEEQESIKSTAAPNAALKSFIETKEGKVIASLVREFLSYFNLDFTVAVFDPESSCSDVILERASLANELNLPTADPEPLLSSLLRQRKDDDSQRSRTEVSKANNSERSNASLGSNKNKSAAEDTSRNQIPKTGSAAPSGGPTRKSSDGDDDVLFDDSLHSGGRGKKSDSDKKDAAPAASGSKPADAAGSGMTSLAGLPSLDAKNQRAPKSTGLEIDLRASDRKAADLGLELGDDYDYDEDFESSNVSPVGPTPRSARSDQNVKSIEEDIEEDIDEDLSVAKDLLKSDDSLMDDLTTDRTVSPAEESAAFDYAEDIPQL